MKRKTELPNLTIPVQEARRRSLLSQRELTARLGVARSTLRRRLQSGDVNAALLIAFSEQLGVNLLEFYLPCLPEQLRITGRERKLREKIEALQRENQKLNEKMAMEREKYEYAIEQLRYKAS